MSLLGSPNLNLYFILGELALVAENIQVEID